MLEKNMKAFCYRSGRVEIAESVPEGALYLSTAPATLLAQTVDSLSQHSDDGSVMYIGGVHEAEDGDAALDAVLDFQSSLNKRLSRALASPRGGHDAISSASQI